MAFSNPSIRAADSRNQSSPDRKQPHPASGKAMEELGGKQKAHSFEWA